MRRPVVETPDSLHVDSTANVARPPADDELPDRMLRKLRIVIPGYTLQSIVGQGGQAIVFKARQHSTGQTVAVKVLREGWLAAAASRERLKREVAALAKLRHPHIVGVIDFGETPDGYDYLVTNFVAGRPLKQVLEESWAAASADAAAPSGDPAAWLPLFVKICQAVEFAHQHGIVHRDLCPANIFIDERGEPCVLDFGVARAECDPLGGDHRQKLTLTGQFVGKLAYASPEQAAGELHRVGKPTDVYALGVMLYEILTGGEHPYPISGSVRDILDNIISVVPLPPNVRIAQRATQAAQTHDLPARAPVSAAVEAMVAKALAKDPAARYSSAGELGTDLDNYLAGRPIIAQSHVLSASESIGRRWKRTAQRGAALAVAVLGIFWASFPPRNTDLPAAPPVPPATDTPLGVAGVPMDLLSLAVLPGDSVRGNWTRTPDGIKATGLPAKLRLRWKPQGEYDFRVSFTRLIGNGYVGQILSYDGHDFAWFYSCGEVNGVQLHGLQSIGNKGSRSNASTVRSGPRIIKGKRHTSLVQIRRGSISVYLDDRLVTRFPTDYSQLSLGELNAVPSGFLGISAWRAPVVFHSAEVIPVDPSHGGSP